MNHYKKNNIKDPIFDQSKWILYGFYYNPDDKRLFPPNRTTYYWLGFGRTINYAHRASPIVVVIALIAIYLFIHFQSSDPPQITPTIIPRTH